MIAPDSCSMSEGKLVLVCLFDNIFVVSLIHLSEGDQVADFDFFL